MLPDRHSVTSGLHLRRALLFAALGYVYVVAVLAVLAGMILALAKLGLGGIAWVFLSGLFFYIVFSLLVTIEPAKGRRVERDECPELFRAIDRARAELRAPAVDAVFLTQDMNAGVLERPRFGIAGWNQRFLMVGLPLLHALAPDELRATLAHEFAHLSRQHSRSRRMLARAQVTWAVLVAGFTNTRWASFLFVPFFRWYTPRLEALAQQSSRAHEIESDRLAARSTGAPAQGRTVLRLAFSTRHMARVVGPRVFRGSLEADAPGPDDFARLLEGIGEPVARDEAARAIRAALRGRTLDSHSHPSLADRLDALRVDAARAEAELLATAPGTDGRPSAATFLGDAGPALAREVGELWAEAVAPLWRQCNADAAVWTAARHDPDPPPDVLWAHARWAAHCEPAETAIPLLRRVPGRAESRVLLGTLLLQQEDAVAQDEAVRLLEAESRLQTRHAAAANDALEEFYAAAGWTRDMRRCRERRTELQQVALRAFHDRTTLSPGDTLRPCPLPAGVRQQLTAAIGEFPEVRRAYLVQKRVRDPDEAPALVLAVEIAAPWHRYTSGTYATEVCTRLLARIQLPEPIDLVLPLERRSSLRRRLSRIAGAEVYRADGRPVAAVPPPDWSAPPRLAWLTFTRALLAGMLLIGVAGALAGPDSEPPTAQSWAAQVPALRDAVREQPDDPEARRDLAWALVESEQWDEARPALEAAVRLNPNDADLRNSLGWALTKAGKPQESLPYLREAIRIDPEHASAQHNLGWALYDLGRFAEAEGHYRQVIRLTPEVANAHWELGWVLVSLNRPEDAEREFRAGARLEPTSPEPHLGLATMFKSRSDLGAAVASLRDAARLAPTTPEIWAEIGHLEHLRGRFAESSAAFTRAELIAPGYFQRDEYRRAIRDASRAGRMYVPE